MDLGSLTAAALALPEPERADLVARSLDSLEGPIDDGAENAWRAEVGRRVAEADLGGNPGVPWAEVKTRLLRQASAHDGR